MADQLIFSQDMSSYLSQISLTGYASTAQINLGGGQFEVVAVPEPSTVIGALALLRVAGFREGRRLTLLLECWRKKGPSLKHCPSTRAKACPVG